MTHTRTRRAPQRSRADLAAAFAARLSTTPAAAYRAHLQDVVNNSEDPADVLDAQHALAELAAADTCEHGRPMDAPCGPCAIAGHEPVDVDEDVEPHDVETCPEGSDCGTCTEDTARRAAAPALHLGECDECGAPANTSCRADCRGEAVTVTERHLAAPLTDNERHLADCRACALLQPDGHEYASLIDVPLTVEELTTLAARPDVDDAVRQVAADCLAELADRDAFDAQHAAPTT